MSSEPDAQSSAPYPHQPGPAAGKPAASAVLDTGLLRALVERSRESILVTTASFEPPGPRIVYVNPALSKLTGHDAVDLLGQSPSVVCIQHAEPSLLTLLRYCARSGEPLTSEIHHQRPHQPENSWAIRIEALTPGTGAPGYLIVYLQNQTRLKALEHAQQDFLSLVTHELRTPLTTILGYAQMMHRRSTPSPASIDAVLTQARHMQSLVDDLLEASSMVTGPIRLHRTDFDLADEARTCTAAAMTASPSHAFTVHTTGLPILIRADRHRVRHAMTHLLANAALYSPANSEISVHVAVHGRYARLVIENQGRGIAADALPRVFERFFRIPSVQPGSGGLGLGLYIVRNIAEAHGGRVHVISHPGGGTCFTLDLPLPQVEV